MPEQHRHPRSPVCCFLGGAGGVFGTALSVGFILHPVTEQIGTSGLEIGVEIFNLSVLFTLPAALLAVAGAVLTLYRLKTGGVVLIAAALMGALGSIVPVLLAYSNGRPDNVVFFTEVGIWWWDLMILAAGVLALVRFHQFLKYAKQLAKTSYV